LPFSSRSSRCSSLISPPFEICSLKSNSSSSGGSGRSFLFGFLFLSLSSSRDSSLSFLLCSVLLSLCPNLYCILSNFYRSRSLLSLWLSFSLFPSLSRDPDDCSCSIPSPYNSGGSYSGGCSSCLCSLFGYCSSSESNDISSAPSPYVVPLISSIIS